MIWPIAAALWCTLFAGVYLLLSRDLQTWETDPPELQEVDATTDADGVLETVRTKVTCSGPMRVFIGLRAQKK